MKRIALVPAFEPEMELMIGTVRELKDAGFEIIVVNDGSDYFYDDIFEKAAEFGIVLRHTENMGKGMAIKTGLSFIRENLSGEYTVVTVDADGQHSAADAANCCRYAERMPDTLILGSRRDEGGAVKVPWESRFGNALTRQIFRLRAGVYIYDTQTGLRAFSDRLAGTLLEIPGERYEYEMNMLLHFADHKMSIYEVAISKIYLNDNEASHFDPIRDSLRIYKCIFRFPKVLKFGLSSFAGFVTDYSVYVLLITLAGMLAVSSAAAVTVSNIIARVISASVNYTINRKYVFRSRDNGVRSALKYAFLACVILAGNTLLLNVMIDRLGINRYLAKLVTEVTFFTLSWIVQKRLIFKSKQFGK